MVIGRKTPDDDRPPVTEAVGEAVAGRPEENRKEQRQKRLPDTGRRASAFFFCPKFGTALCIAAVDLSEHHCCCSRFRINSFGDSPVCFLNTLLK